MEDENVIPVPKPSGEVSFGSFADDLKLAYRDARPDTDPWKAVARVAVRWAGQVLPEVKD